MTADIHGPERENTSHSDDLPVITAVSVASYLTCRRAWWLSEVQGAALHEELLDARALMARRRQLSQRLAVAGGLLVALSLVIFVLGIVLT